jgi:SNF2 family DNA or RNA helicase
LFIDLNFSHWENEIASKFESKSLRVCLYYGRNRDDEELRKYDVVITTYGTLSSDFKESGEKTGLFGLHWHRIILDEAHTIKNSKAKISKAAAGLEADFRWCLTGTIP